MKYTLTLQLKFNRETENEAKQLSRLLAKVLGGVGDDPESPVVGENRP